MKRVTYSPLGIPGMRPEQRGLYIVLSRAGWGPGWSLFSLHNLDACWWGPNRAWSFCIRLPRHVLEFKWAYLPKEPNELQRDR